MAHPLVTRLHYHLKSRFPLVRLAVREGQGAQLEALLESGGVDLAILYRQRSSARNGDIYLVETDTYLVGPIDSAVTAPPEVAFSILHELPLVHFCRPNGWRDRLDQLAADHGIALNVVLEADSLALQTHVVAEGGAYALLGPYAITAAAKQCPIKAAKLVSPSIVRHIALAMSPYGELTLACRTVMEIAQEIVRSDSAILAAGSLELSG